MFFDQYRLTLRTQPKRCLLITDEIVRACPGLARVEKGMLQLFLRHTSASLTINENADVRVRRDMEMSLERLVPGNWPYQHDDEGPDDMPAHVKSSLFGVSLLIPVTEGRLQLGTWQGVYLCEHRSAGHDRELVCSLWGEARVDSVL